MNAKTNILRCLSRSPLELKANPDGDGKTQRARVAGVIHSGGAINDGSSPRVWGTRFFRPTGRAGDRPRGRQGAGRDEGRRAWADLIAHLVGEGFAYESVMDMPWPHAREMAEAATCVFHPIVTADSKRT